MKHKTAELEGALLDLAVAKALKLTAELALDFVASVLVEEVELP